MSAWLEAQRSLQGGPAKAPANAEEAMRRGLAFGGDYLGIAGDWWRIFAQGPAGAPGMAPPAAMNLEPLRAHFIELYQRLFTPEIAMAAVAQHPAAGMAAAGARCQAAAQRFAGQVVAIATDAFRRLSTELATTDATAAPITSLRELHELWIECGEAAYAAAAHGDDFAEAQAELLAAFVELRFEQQRLRA